MKPTQTKASKTPERINIKISGKAYRKLSRVAKKEGRTILATVDKLVSD